MDTLPEWRNLKVTSAGGVMEVRFHTKDGPMVWGGRAGFEMTTLFDTLSRDDTVKVLILTGTGDSFCSESVTFDFTKMRFRDAWTGEQRMLGRLIDLNVIVIAAVNGPVHFHPEVPLLADIVLACPEAEFAELGHFPRNMAPGDGAQLVMGDLIGSSRTNYFYLTEQRIGADEAHRLGVVHEIHPRDALMTRARELAQSLAQRPAAVLAYSKAALSLAKRRSFHEDLSHGMAIQGMGLYAAGLSGPEQ